MATDGRACPLCGGAPGRRRWRTAAATVATCRHCGFTYQTHRTAEAEAQTLATYERIYARAPAENELTAQSYAAVLSRFERYRGSGLVVDIGCGAGAFLAAAARAGWRAVGTELASSAGTVPPPAGARIVVGPDVTSTIATSSADVVTLWEVVEHVDDPVALLAEAARIARPGGLVYLTTPNHASLSRRLMGARWPRYHVEHAGYFSTRTISDALARAGLPRARTSTRTFDPFVLAGAFRARDPLAPADATRVGAIERGREGLRRFTKRTAVGGMVLRLVNRALAASGLGDTLVAEVERP